MHRTVAGGGTEDTATYCFSSSSCVNKLSQLHRAAAPPGPVTKEDLMTEREKLEAEQRGQSAHAPVELEMNLREVY